MNRDPRFLLIPGAIVFLLVFFYFLNSMFLFFFPGQSLFRFLLGGLPEWVGHLVEYRLLNMLNGFLFFRVFTVSLSAAGFVGIVVAVSRLYFRFRRAGSLKTAELILSRDDTATPFEVMGALDSVYGNLVERFFRLFKGQDHFVWEVVKDAAGIKFYVTSPADKLEAVKKRLQSTYQNLRFQDAGPVDDNYHVLQQYGLARPWFYTLKSLRDYQSSIVESLVNVLDGAAGRARVQFVLVPAPMDFQQRIKRMQEIYEREHLLDKIQDQASPGIGYTQDKELKGSLEMIGKGFFQVEVRLGCDSWSTARGVAGVLAEASAENRIIPPNFFQEFLLRVFRKLWLRWLGARMPAVFFFRNFYLSSFHLATLIHLPSVRVRVSTLNRYPVRRAVAPLGICRDPEKAILRDEDGPVGIFDEDRKYNILLLGGQGMGKSTTMENIIKNDAEDKNKAMVIIDPNNDLAVKALGLIPPDREVIYLNVADGENRLGINPLSTGDVPDVLVTNVINTFRQFWGKEAIGPRSEELLINTMYALLDVEPSITFYEVYRMMAEVNYRSMIVSRLKDEHQRLYWQHTFEAVAENGKFLEEALSAPRNKLNRILSVSNVRRVLTSRHSIDLKRLISRRRILVVNLAKGAVGEENAYLLGIFLITMLWQAIQSQVSLPPGERVPVSLVVDEAHNFLCPGLEKLLSEGRKFGGQNTLAFQFMGQIDYEKVRKAVVNLAQNIILFRTEELEDAENFSKTFMRLYSNMIQISDEVQDRLNFGPDDILNLPAYKAITRLVARGEVTAAFLAEAIPTKVNEEWAGRHRARQADLLPDNIQAVRDEKDGNCSGYGYRDVLPEPGAGQQVGDGTAPLDGGKPPADSGTGDAISQVDEKSAGTHENESELGPLKELADKSGVSLKEIHDIIARAGADREKGEKVARWVLTRPDLDKIKKPHLLFRSVLLKKADKGR